VPRRPPDQRPPQAKLLRQVTRRNVRSPLVGGDALTENGVIEQAVEFVRRNTHVTATLEDGARRVERRDYPDEPVREAIIDALAHRDYLLSASDVELSLYSDRLEIISPAGFPTTSRRNGCESVAEQRGTNS
jgi:hypothetical protein